MSFSHLDVFCTVALGVDNFEVLFDIFDMNMFKFEHGSLFCCMISVPHVFWGTVRHLATTEEMKFVRNFKCNLLSLV